MTIVPRRQGLKKNLILQESKIFPRFAKRRFTTGGHSSPRASEMFLTKQLGAIFDRRNFVEIKMSKCLLL
jgi:hypothetical protein